MEKTRLELLKMLDECDALCQKCPLNCPFYCFSCKNDILRQDIFKDLAQIEHQ